MKIFSLGGATLAGLLTMHGLVDAHGPVLRVPATHAGIAHAFAIPKTIVHPSIGPAPIVHAANVVKLPVAIPASAHSLLGNYRPPSHISGIYNLPGTQLSGTYQSGAKGFISGALHTPTTNWNGNLSAKTGNFNYSSPQTQFSGSYKTGSKGFLKSSGNHGGTTWSGQLSHNASNFNYSNPTGYKIGGGYTYQNSKNNNLTGHFYAPSGQGFGGSLGKTNGNTVLDGNYRMPIVVGGVPVAQAAFGGHNVFAGKNSTMSAYGNVYDPTGSVKVVGVGDQLDRHNYSQQQQVGIGPVRANTASSVHFAGINSTFNNGLKFSAPGANVQAMWTGNRQGVSTNPVVNLGSARLNGTGNIQFAGIKSNVAGGLNFNAPGLKVNTNSTFNNHAASTKLGANLGSAQLNGTGSVHFAGIKSTLNGGVKFNAPGLKANTNLTLNKNGASTKLAANVGSIRVNGKGGIHFAGTKSSLTSGVTFHAPGLKVKSNSSFNIHGATTKLAANVGAVHVNVSTPHLPKLSHPKW